MKLTKYIGGSDADKHSSELADTSILTPTGCNPFGWTWENWWEESREGELYICLTASAAADSPPDVYGLNIKPEEFGALFASVCRSADVQAVMRGFLQRASPEIIGAVVGSVISHLTRRGNVPPAEPCSDASG